MSSPLTIDFFHDVVCCWCFNISSRMRVLASELNLEIRHRTFVLQASPEEMAGRWGTPDEARETILGHWSVCRQVSDRPEMINISKMQRATFHYPHGWTAALACKAAERLGGQSAHWNMFDCIQSAHLTDALNIADRTVLDDLARDIGLNIDAFTNAMADSATAQAVEEDRQRARALQVRSIPALIVRGTGARLINGPIEDLRAQISVAGRLLAHS